MLSHAQECDLSSPEFSRDFPTITYVIVSGFEAEQQDVLGIFVAEFVCKEKDRRPDTQGDQ